MSATRRQFLSAAALLAATAAPAQKIVSVEATPVNLWPRSTQGALPKFRGPDDPQRWRYTGPFAQLASAMIVTIKTDQGVVGYGPARRAAAANIIHGHLRNLLLGMNPSTSSCCGTRCTPPAQCTDGAESS
ncbi:MAG: twin-arginine translocation signal domain-containing protein [Bryobacterales bacterium]